jgi:GH15 family glucan-1,4-alpha-glucosidase
MCWVAVDRAIRLAEKRSFPAPLPEWNSIRSQIYNSIHEEFWNADLNSFVQYPGGTTPDGSMLLMPLVRFISPQDPRWLSTLAHIEHTLVDDALVHRRTAADRALDGLTGEEGSFLACSFWYVECLARGGEVARARLLFEKLLAYGNHVGLYAEELSPSGRHLGNTPQVLTHLAIISAASYLDRALSGGHQPAWS